MLAYAVVSVGWFSRLLEHDADGTRLGRMMPYDWYAKIAPADLNAVVAYLRSLKPLKTPGF